MRLAAVAFALVLAACSGTSGDATTTSTLPPTTTSPTTPEAPTTTTAPPVEPVLVPTVTVTGPPEVAWDWTTDRCEDEHIPDIAARAIRDADGRVQLIIGHYVNYRSIGPNLEEVVSDCSRPILVSDWDPDPSQFNDSEWIGGLYTVDGATIYAVVHNEYRGDTHGRDRPGQCPSGERLTCLDTSLTMAISTDGGDTYDDILSAPDHMIATLPYVFDDEGVPSGLRQPSNIVQGPDDYFYVFSNISDFPDEEQWVCAMRTNDLADPTSWRFWDGSDFTGEFVNPYATEVGPDTPKCAPLDRADLAGGINETVVYDEVVERYVMMGVAFHPTSGAPHWGVYYSTSTDLADWSQRRLLLEVPTTPTVGNPDFDLYFAYPSIIDPDSPSPSFATSDGDAYLYMTRFNAGGSSLDRDLVRWPIHFEYAPPFETDWGFDADTDGWLAEHGLAPLVATDGTLIAESIADDPYLAVYDLAIPAADFDSLTVRMRVSGEDTAQGQVFFGTATQRTHTEQASIVFNVSADGEYHDYVLDMSTIPGWTGTVVSLRLDPVPDSGRVVEIDRIWLEPD